MNHKEHGARILTCSGRTTNNEEALAALEQFVRGRAFEISPRGAEQLTKLAESAAVQHSDGTADMWRAVLKAGKKAAS